MVLKRFFVFLILTVMVFSLLAHITFAQTNSFKEETLEAVVSNIKEEKEIKVMDKKQLYQKIELTVTKGSLKDNKIIVENGTMPMANIQKYHKGDRVFVSYSKDNQGKDSFFIKDYIRRGTLFILLLLFIILTVGIARVRGITSLIGMGVSFLMIFCSILPNILNGSDPVVAVIMASIIIIPVTFFLSHGFNKKTTVAIVSTFIAIVITGILSAIFIEVVKLTGFSSEEAGYLQIFKEGAINMKGILLAGIIIGALGVLDDITISQAAVVFQLKEANRRLTRKELYEKAMNVGQDHISSMINTLVLVYAGASLPLLLLFINNPHPFSEIINYEMIAEEIVRTLVGSIGLILAVPITTYIATLTAVNKNGI